MALNKSQIDEEMEPQTHLKRLNAVRIFVALAIAFGYASTMPLGPDKLESFQYFGIQPSWVGIQVLFFFSGFLALKSLDKGHSAWRVLSSRIQRIFPMLLCVTLCVVLVIFPWMGQSDEGFFATSTRLAQYFILTVLCIDPGVPLPGLFDDALYMCLIQGAIWTFRYGALLYIGTAIVGALGIFKHRPLILLGAVMTTLFYTTGAYLTERSDIVVFAPAMLLLRLSYPFFLGMAVWAYREMMPRARVTHSTVLIALFGYAAMTYTYMQWTPFIEITICGFWMYLAWAITVSSTNKLAWLDNWPDLALGIYIINWPVSQIGLALFPELGRWTLPLFNLPITLLLSYGLHSALSRPLKIKPAFLSRRKITV